MFKRLIYLIAVVSFILGMLRRAQDAGHYSICLSAKIISDCKRKSSCRATTVCGDVGGEMETVLANHGVELYGDASALRIPWWADEVAPPAQRLVRAQTRTHRLRIGLRGVLADDWFFGVG